MYNTKIEWCHSTLNFWSGCTKVSPGCANCYAETLSNRFGMSPEKAGNIGLWGPGAPRKLHEAAFKAAHRLNRKPWVCDKCGHCQSGNTDVGLCRLCGTRGTFHRRRIFSLSLGDWLDPEIPVEWLARMLDTIRQCDQVRWLLLTKQPDSWATRITQASHYAAGLASSGDDWDVTQGWLNAWVNGNTPANVLIGTSVEDQQRAEERIPALLRIPAAGRFLSIEPLLGPVMLNGLCQHGLPADVQWLIVGGESGPMARPCNVEWIRSLVRQGREAGVETFVKQMGSNSVSGDPRDEHHRMLWKHPKGGDQSEWPEDLRVREFPGCSDDSLRPSMVV